MRRSRAVVLFALLGLAVAYIATLPPRARALPPLAAGTSPVRGAMHIHTQRSDGTGTVDDVAAAAARAGLRFVILTDHGDATRKPDPPTYTRGVLVIDAVEVSTSGGHVVAIGLGQAPYPLGGEPRDVIDDIERLGGFPIAAHPDSAKASLRWTGWDTPIQGLEWLNADSEWRDEGRWSIARALLAYPMRSREAVAMLFDRPDATIRRWDELTRRRPIVAVAAPDAHARIGLRSLGEPYDSTALRIPSYETMFRTMTLALPDLALSGDATRDANAVIGAIRQGRVYSMLDGLASPATVAFTARSGTYRATQGEELPLDGTVTLHIDAQVPSEAAIVILKDGDTFHAGSGPTIEKTAPPEPAVYRVEVRLPGAPGVPPVPWIVSNPIYVGRMRPAAGDPSTHEAATTFSPVYEDGTTAPARVERSDESPAALDVVRAVPAGRQLLFRYALGGRPSASPYAAIAFPAAGLAAFDRMTFTARADHPMRLAVQLRVPTGAGDRWQRSIYLDDVPRTVIVYFDEMSPVGNASGNVPRGDVDSLLLVVDAVNTKLGANGQVWIDDIKYAR